MPDIEDHNEQVAQRMIDGIHDLLGPRPGHLDYAAAFQGLSDAIDAALAAEPEE